MAGSPEPSAAADGDPDQADPVRRRLRGHVVAALPTVAVATGCAAACLVVVHDDLRQDWFSDELWRAVFVHSPHWWELYTSWDTPTSIGFVYAFKTLGLVVPTGPLTLRIATLVAFVAALAMTWRLIVGIMALRPSRGSHSGLVDAVTATAAVVVLPLLPAFGLERVFVPYFFEMAGSAALVLACFGLGRRRWAFPGALALVAALPLFTIGSLFLLPVAVGTMAWWAWRQPARVRHLLLVGAAATVGAVAALLAYLVVYRPVQRQSIDSFWQDSVLSGNPRGLGGLLVDLFHGVEAGLLGWSHASALGDADVLVTLLTAAALVTGAVVLGRRWLPYVLFPLVGQIAIVAASAVAGWPMTAERVNLAVHFFVYVTITFGVATWVRVTLRVGAAFAGRWEHPYPGVATPGDGWLVASAVGLLAPLVVLVWPSHATPLPFDAFLRGLSRDLTVVADSPTADNVVVTYHFSSQWYARERLLLTRHGDRRFTLVSETYDEPRVYDPAWLDRTLAPLAQAGDRVWCVVPFDVGPDRAARACRLGPRYEPVAVYRGRRSDIREFLVL
jgi:hypothetical protein